MKMFFLFLLFLITGCTSKDSRFEPGVAKEEKIFYLKFARDSKRGVVCYRFADHEGMFCFNESKLNQGETK